MPDPGTLFGITLVGGLAAWIASLYLRDARDCRAGRGDDAFAWRRNSHPNVPATPKPVLQVLPRRWGWRHLVIAAVQVAAIGALTFGMVSDMGTERLGGFFLVNVIVVAFTTALLTHLWDLASAALARRRARSRQRQ